MKKRTQSWIGALVMPLAMSAGLAQAGDMADDGKMMGESTMMEAPQGMAAEGMAGGSMDGKAMDGEMAGDMAGDMGHGMEEPMNDTMAEPMMDDDKMMGGKTMEASDGM